MPAANGIINFQELAADPAWNDAGALYYNNTSQEFRYNDGTGWRKLYGANYYPLEYQQYEKLWTSWPGASGSINLSPHIPAGTRFVKLRIYSRLAADRDTTGRLNLKSSNGIITETVYTHYDRVGDEWHSNGSTAEIQVQLDSNQDFVYQHQAANVASYRCPLIGYWR